MDSISGNFWSLAGFLSLGFDSIVHVDVLTSAILSYFLISGFLFGYFGYLWTRLFLSSDVRIAELWGGLGERIGPALFKLDGIECYFHVRSFALKFAVLAVSPGRADWGRARPGWRRGGCRIGSAARAAA